MITLTTQFAPPIPTPKSTETVINCKPYGDFSNPVQHSHLFRWGVDQILKIKRIQPKKEKKCPTKKKENNTEKQFFLNNCGHYIQTKPL